MGVAPQIPAVLPGVLQVAASHVLADFLPVLAHIPAVRPDLLTVLMDVPGVMTDFTAVMAKLSTVPPDRAAVLGRQGRGHGEGQHGEEGDMTAHAKFLVKVRDETISAGER